MKQICRDSIQNIEGTDIFDEIFVFENMSLKKENQRNMFVPWISDEIIVYENNNVLIVFLEDILQKRKNDSLLEKIQKYPAMWSEVYSPKDELEIFSRLFDFAIWENKKIHIIWITLWKEIDMLEKYYHNLWFFDTDNNTFKPDFSIPLVTVSVKIENIMWRGSDYKRLWNKIFLCPPIREAWEVKNLFKWINRGVIAGVYFCQRTEEVTWFLEVQIKEETFLPLTLWKLLKYNYESIWLWWVLDRFQLSYISM